MSRRASNVVRSQAERGNETSPRRHSVSVPFVLGTPGIRGSNSTAMRSERAVDLKIGLADVMAVAAVVQQHVQVQRALAAVACQKSSTNSLSKSPIFAAGKLT